MKVDEALEKRPDELAWDCGPDRATGADVLAIARPGLRLVTAADAPVPRAVFHRWMFATAERLLEAHVGYGHLEDHESEWLVHALGLIATTAEVPGDDAEEIRGQALMTRASLNTFSVIRHGPREMGDIYEWSGDALSWATKRHTLDRRCPHDPVTLHDAAAEIHRSLAVRRAADPDEAVVAERAAQVETLLETWRIQRDA